MPNFTLFRGRSMPVYKLPSVTVQKTGVFTLNHAAIEALGSPQGVELLYDQDAHIIGFRSAKMGIPHVYQINKALDSRTYLVSAGAFLKYFTIPHDVTRRFQAYLDDGVLCVNLEGETLPPNHQQRNVQGHESHEPSQA